jgi:hypothetical protein
VAFNGGFTVKRIFALVLCAGVLLAALPGCRASADEGFELAKSVVDALSSGTYSFSYKNNPASFAPITVYSTKDGMVVTYSERQPHPRHLSRDGDLYVINDSNRIMEIHEGRGQPPMPFFGAGPYKFAGRGEETEEEKTLRFEEAAMDDGTKLRFFFEDSEQLLFFKIPVLARIEVFTPGSEEARAVFFTAMFSDQVQDRLFEVPTNYELRKTLQQLKQDAAEGKMPDDPVDRMVIQMLLSEDAR